MLVARGTPSSVILAMAEHLTWPNYTVEQTREDLAKMIDGARRKGFGEPDASCDPVDDVMAVPPKASPLLPMLTVDELLALPDPEWLIVGLLVENSLAVLYGPFRSYKSFVAVDWALSLATGIDWCGHQVSQCDVLYILGEGVPGTKLRVVAWLQHHGHQQTRPRLPTDPMRHQLDGPSRSPTPDLDRGRGEQANRLQPEAGHPRNLAPFHVWRRREQREGHGRRHRQCGDHPTRVGLYTASCPSRRERRRTRLAWLISSSGLPGAMDTVFRLTRNENRATLLVEKQKDAEDGQEVHLRAELVNVLAAKRHVAPRSSLVLVLDDTPSDPTNHLSPTQRRAKEILVDLIASEGKPLPQGGAWPSPVNGMVVHGVAMERWQQECDARRLSNAQERKHRNEAFQRVSQALLNNLTVAARDDWVWLT